MDTRQGNRSGALSLGEHTLEILEYEKIRQMLSERCGCGMGRALIARLRPLRRAERIQLFIDQTTEMKNLMSLGRLPLARLEDPRPAVRRSATQGILSEKDFHDVRSALTTTKALKEMFCGLGTDYPRLKELAERMMDFPELLQAIEETIDERGQVCTSASPRLREVRGQVESLRAILKARAYELASSPALRAFLQSETVMLRNERYVLPVKVECKNMVDGVVHDRSQTGSTLFVEPQELVLIGNQLEIALADERHEVSRILGELTIRLRQCRDDLLRTFDMLAWVDFTYAKAKLSMDFEMNPPVLNSDGILDLKGACHPLLLEIARRARQGQEDGPLRLKFATARRGAAAEGNQSPPAPVAVSGPESSPPVVVPIDVRVGEDFQILVITGPNTGGKTVALKTMGLVALMAMSGMHIPAAAGSRCAVFDHVFADIGDEQSIEQSLSTFSSHMKNIARIVRQANARSLVLLDELGAGTDPAEGASLAMAILDRLLQMGARAAITTHIGLLKTYAYRQPKAQNACVEFDPETLLPTYRLLIGQPGSSNAIVIAERLGVPRQVTRAAGRLLARTERGRTDELMVELQRSRTKIEEDRARSEQAAQETRRLQQEAEERLRQIAARESALQREAEEVLDGALRRIRDRVDEVVKVLQNAPKPFRERAEELRRAIEDEIAASPLARRREEFARQLDEGMQVYVPRFGRHFKVMRIDKAKRRLTISGHHIQMEIPFDDVSWLRAEDVSPH